MNTDNNEYNKFTNHLNSKLGFNFLPLNSPELEVPKEFEDLDPMQILLQLNRKATEIFFLSQYISEQNQAVNSFLKNANELNIANSDSINKIDVFNKLHVQSLANHSVDFLKKLNSATIDLSEDTITRLDQIGELASSIVKLHERTVPRTTKFIEKFQYWIAGTSFFLVILVVFMMKMTINWYEISVQTREEVRNGVLAEIINAKKEIYSVDYVSTLKENTTIIQSWMKKNAKSSEVQKFIQFKEGYEAKKDSK